MTLDDLVVIFEKNCADPFKPRKGISAVVRALRDEIRKPHYSSWEDIDDFLDQILGSDAGEKVTNPAPVYPDEHLVVSATGLGLSPAPAPAPCLWRVHHETRNGPLYVSQCDGEWRHATADPKCPSCKKEIFFVTDPALAARSDATAVCEWRVVHSSFGQSFFASGCFKQHDNIFGGICPSCGKPIKFTEAK